MLRRYYGKISFLDINEFVGKDGELVVDDTTGRVYVMDGETPGGQELVGGLIDGNINLGNLYVIDQTIVPANLNANVNIIGNLQLDHTRGNSFIANLGAGFNQGFGGFRFNATNNESDVTGLVHSNQTTSLNLTHASNIGVAVYPNGSVTFPNGVSANVRVNASVISSSFIASQGILHGYRFHESSTGIVAPTSIVHDSIENQLKIIHEGGTGIAINSNSSVKISNITIDNTTINSNLDIILNANLIPGANLTYSLGNIDNQWNDLWISNSTIYIGGVAVSVNEFGNLLVDGNEIATKDYVADVVSGNVSFELGNWQFENNTLSNDGAGDAIIQASSFAGAGIVLKTGISAPFKDLVLDQSGNLTIPGYLTFWDSSVQETAYRFSATDTAPTITTGAQWFNTEEGRLYINYNNAWVEASPTQIDPLAIRFNELNQIELPGGGIIDGSDFDIDIIAGNDGNSTYGHVSFTTNSPNGLNSLTYNSLGEITVSTASANDGLIKWVGNSSGDGNGYTTMVMVPDTTVEGNDQYLIVDPTLVNHIHIRAGGTQDNSNADLFLGGENSHFRVNSGLNPNVSISANNNIWTFGTDGNLTVPGWISSTTGTLVLNANVAQSNLAWGIQNDIFGANSSALVAPASDEQNQGQLIFPGANGVGYGALAWTGNVGSPFDSSMILGSVNSNVSILTAFDSTINLWRFDTDGNLTLPENGTVSYTPTNSSDWDGIAPTTIQEAIDRLAAVIKVLNSGTGA